MRKNNFVIMVSMVLLLLVIPNVEGQYDNSIIFLNIDSIWGEGVCIHPSCPGDPECFDEIACEISLGGTWEIISPIRNLFSYDFVTDEVINNVSINHSIDWYMEFIDNYLYLGSKYEGESLSISKYDVELNLLDYSLIPFNKGFILDITYDDTYLYVASDGLVSQHYKDNLTFTGNHINISYRPKKVLNDNDYLYVTNNFDSTIGNIRKYHKENLTYTGIESETKGFINGLAMDDDYVYAGGKFGFFNVTRYYKDNLSNTGLESMGFDDPIQGIYIKDNFLYEIGENSRSVRKYYLENLSYINETIQFSNQFRNIVFSDYYMYFVSGTFVHKVDIETLEVENSSIFDLLRDDRIALYIKPVLLNKINEPQSLMLNQTFFYFEYDLNYFYDNIYNTNLIYNDTIVNNSNNYTSELLDINITQDNKIIFDYKGTTENTYYFTIIVSDINGYSDLFNINIFYVLETETIIENGFPSWIISLFTALFVVLALFVIIQFTFPKTKK